MKRIEEFEAILSKMDTARLIENIDERESVRDKLYDSIADEKKRVFRLYANAQERENDLIDIDDWDAKNVPMLLKELRGCAIAHITVSSSWSGLPDLMWAFVENGCAVLGMIQINQRRRDWETGKFPKMPAFLVRI